MAALSFSPPPSSPPSNRLRIGSRQMMSGGASGKRPRMASATQGDALVVEQHAQLRRGDEVVARAGDDRGVEPDLLHALAQVVVLDLGLQIEHAQRPRRREAEERHAGRHVDEQADQEVALADLRRAAQHQQPARRQHARRDDVLAASGERSSSSCAEARRPAAAGRRLGVCLVAQQRRAVLLRHAAPRAGRLPACRRSTGQAGRSMAALYWQIASQPSFGADACPHAPGGCNGRWRRWRPRSASRHRRRPHARAW